MKIAATSSTPQMPTGAPELAAHLPKDAKLGKACDQFEGMLVRQILQDGMKPLLAKPPGSGATGAGMYDYMISDALANGLAGKNGMGISHLLQTQLTPRASASQPASHP